MTSTRTAILLVCFALAAATNACTSTGTATGHLVTPSGNRAVVTFRWRSDAGDWHRGKLSVVLPGGERYSGSYRQVSQMHPVAVYGPMWVGWEPFWPDWPTPWYRGTLGASWDGWVRVYGGRVVARLEGRNPERAMRCRFTLDDPARGLSGGGNGDCQLSDGSIIERAELFPEEESD
ncbi:MAG: hypothetical protein ACOY0T_38460 [Myxococcota bacterium]